MWDITYLIKDFIACKNIQKFINHRYKDESTSVIPKYLLDGLKKDCYVQSKYSKFTIDSVFDLTMIPTVEEYSYKDLRKTDNVLDVGANGGAFSLKVAPYVNHVYAIEPIKTNWLIQNIKLNHVKNITVMNYGLGKKGINKISWNGETFDVLCLPLSDLISSCGVNIDFLKLDCEGAEFCIRPEELQGIRRIEGEIHPDKSHYVIDFNNILDLAGFVYEEIPAYIFHANKSPDKKDR